MSRSISSLALAAALALGGCATGGNQNAPPNPFPLGNAPATTGSAVLTTMAGVGDSLTAGEQSSGLVGQNAANPFFPATSALPFLPATQTSGFWALLWSAAHGGASAANVLPLIKSPGIGTYMIPLTNGSFTALQSNCSGLNASAFDPVGATTTRVSTSLPFDLGVPGQTVHEALYAIAPVGSCAILSVAPFSLFQSENQNIYPILSANFPGLSQVRAAASLHPTLTTVWLGANDLLKYLFSAGAFGPTPTALLQADLQTTVQTLQAAGSQVVIANLPNVLHTALFIPIANLGPALVGLGVPAAAALPFAGGVAAVNNLGPGSYVLFSALGPIIAALPTGKPPVLTPGSQVVPAAFAAGFQAVNDAYNAAIATVASATGAPLVDDRTALDQAAAQGVPVNPPKCCSSVFGGGLFSFDGIHPSNTGYAIIANLFIGAINAKWGTSIPPINVQAVYATDPYAPH